MLQILTIKQLLQSREKEICFLKSKINIQEIDIKALSLASDFHRPSTSEDSNVLTREYSFDDINLNHLRKDFPQERVSKSLLLKMQVKTKCYLNREY